MKTAFRFRLRLRRLRSAQPRTQACSRYPRDQRRLGTVLAEFSRQAWQVTSAVTSHPKSPRTTGKEAAFRLWSSENQIVGVGSRSRKTKPITKRGSVHCDWLILPLLLPTPTIWFSLDHKRKVSDGVVSGVGRKWKLSDSSDSDSVALMTPLTTPISDFH